MTAQRTKVAVLVAAVLLVFGLVRAAQIVEYSVRVDFSSWVHAGATMVRGASRWLIAASTVTCLFVAACGPSEPPAEVCTSILDEDGDGLSACDDSDCWVPGGVCDEVCSTIFDEDGDGMIGCADSDCWSEGTTCPEVCDSDEDEDADGVAGCADSDCWGATGNCPEVCETEFDEDGDTNAGCADSDCWIEGGSCEERCEGGNDEDADGSVDCDDDDCRLIVPCAPSFDSEVQAILKKHCADCHTGDEVLGGLDLDKYEDFLKPAIYCTGMTKGECSVFRIKEPSMPEDCLGCVPDEDVEQLELWVEAGMPK